MALIPPIGTAGIYDLKAPFSAKLQPRVSYRCEAVRKISDFIEEGIDPYEEFYVPNGLSQAVYQADMLNNACIVSLQSSSGHWVYVPTTYINSYPNVNGVAYRGMVLGVELGPIPEYMDLAAVKVAVGNVIRDVLGVRPTIKEVAITSTQNFSQQDHDILEANRAALVQNSDTDRAKLLDLQVRFAALQRDYQTLVDASLH